MPTEPPSTRTDIRSSRDKTKSRSIERIRINHYYARSEQEVRAKHQRRATFFLVDPAAAPDGWRRESDVEATVRRMSAPGPLDETILMHAPAVRAAVTRRSQGPVRTKP